MKIIYIVFFSIFLFLVLTFSAENSEKVTLKYYGFFRQELPLSILVVVCFMVGVLFTGLVGILERFRMSMTIKRLDRTVKELRKQIKDSEPLPIIENNLYKKRSDKNGRGEGDKLV